MELETDAEHVFGRCGATHAGSQLGIALARRVSGPEQHAARLLWAERLYQFAAQAAERLGVDQ